MRNRQIPTHLTDRLATIYAYLQSADSWIKVFTSGLDDPRAKELENHIYEAQEHIAKAASLVEKIVRDDHAGNK